MQPRCVSMTADSGEEIGLTALRIRLIRLRYKGTCSGCGRETTPGEQAWWEASTKTVTCTACRPTATSPTVSTLPAAVAPPMDTGVAGASARRRYERLHERRKQDLERRWG